MLTHSHGEVWCCDVVYMQPCAARCRWCHITSRYLIMFLYVCDYITMRRCSRGVAKAQTNETFGNCMSSNDTNVRLYVPIFDYVSSYVYVSSARWHYSIHVHALSASWFLDALSLGTKTSLCSICSDECNENTDEPIFRVLPFVWNWRLPFSARFNFVHSLGTLLESTLTKVGGQMHLSCVWNGAHFRSFFPCSCSFF